MSNNNFPKRHPNTVTEGIPDGWHNAQEYFGSKNPDDPDDPGTIDDSVDIKDPGYNDAIAKEIEDDLAKQDGLPPRENEQDDLAAEEKSFAIEEPNVPDPY